MANPRLLPCDSDVLVQFFAANELRPLRDLRKLYGIVPVVVQEVEFELRWLGHHKDKFVTQLDKAVKSGLISRLDKTLFQSYLSAAPAGSSWSSYQSLGAQYQGYVDRGEAYTHAAGIVLGTPTASNDYRAIQVLQFQMMNLPSPVLRSFDLLALALEAGTMSVHDCETSGVHSSPAAKGYPKLSSTVLSRMVSRTSGFDSGIRAEQLLQNPLLASPIRFS